MKIAFVFPPASNPFSGSALGIWNYQITSRLAEYCDVSVYSGPFSSQKEGQCYQSVCYRSISANADRWFGNYPSIFFRGNKPSYTSIFFFLGYAFKIAYDLRLQKCDVVHLYNFPTFIPIIKALNPRIRIALNIHGDLLSQFAFGKIRRYLRGTDVIISCSELISEKVRARFPEFASRCETVFMGVDPDHFSPGKTSTFAGVNEVKRLLYVGRLSPEKGVHILLDALATVVDHYPETLLDIVGSEGIMRMEYLVTCSLAQSHFAELTQFYSDNYGVSALRERLPQNLRSRVTFHGFVPHDELPNYYRNSDVYINPSYYESFGMSNIEAMACGTPVVTTPVGAVPEVIDHGKTGFLVEPGNSLALAEGIIRILYDMPLRESITKAAYEKAVSCFSWQCACEKLYSLYNRIM